MARIGYFVFKSQAMTKARALNKLPTTRASIATTHGCAKKLPQPEAAIERSREQMAPMKFRRKVTNARRKKKQKSSAKQKIYMHLPVRAVSGVAELLVYGFKRREKWIDGFLEGWTN